VIQRFQLQPLFSQAAARLSQLDDAGTANYGKGYMADLVIYRMKADVPRGRVAPSMQIKLLGRSL
jgi:hypothetical protein